MKSFLLLAAAVSLCAQTPTVITGPLPDSSGGVANCSVLATPRAVPGASATTIRYQIVGGDVSGATGGYGNPRAPIRRAQLALLPGTYSVVESCSGARGTHTYKWMVPPGGSFDIGRLNSGSRRTFGEITTAFGSTPGKFGDQ